MINPSRVKIATTHQFSEREYQRHIVLLWGRTGGMRTAPSAPSKELEVYEDMETGILTTNPKGFEKWLEGRA